MNGLFAIDTPAPSDREHARLLRRIERGPLTRRPVRGVWVWVLLPVAIVAASALSVLLRRAESPFFELVYPTVISAVLLLTLGRALRGVWLCDRRDRVLQRPDLMPEGTRLEDLLAPDGVPLVDVEPIDEHEFEALRARLVRRGRLTRVMLLAMLPVYPTFSAWAYLDRAPDAAMWILVGTTIPAVVMLFWISRVCSRDVQRMLTRLDFWDLSNTHPPVHAIARMGGRTLLLREPSESGANDAPLRA